MLEIGKRYERIAPNKDRSIAIIDSEQTKQYQESYIALGFVFKEIKVSAPNEGTCIACEG